MPERTTKSGPIKAVARQFVLNDELQSFFIGSFEALEAQLRPRTALEEHLVRYIGISAWRVARMVTLEKAVFEHQMVQQQAPGNGVVLGAQAYRDLADNSRVLELMGRSETRAFRAFKDAINLFIRIREQLPPLESATPVSNAPEPA